MKLLGIDLGYNATKIVSSTGKVQFPSIVGTPDKSSFQIVGASGFSIKHNNKHYNIGNVAAEQSRFVTRKEDREWINSDEYMVLFHAALSTQFVKGPESVTVVTGLPLAYYDADKQNIKEQFERMHHVFRDDRNVVTLNVEKCSVVPQPMGTLAHVAFDDEGNITNSTMLTGRVGIIDIGGKTTNILHALRMADIRAETESVAIGGWDVVRAMQSKVESACPGVGYSDHEISEAVKKMFVKYKGRVVDLSQEVNSVLDKVTQPILSKVRELWAADGARLDQILISGGGAHLIGDRLKSALDHENVELVDDPVFANAMGYYKLAKWQEKSNG